MPRLHAARLLAPALILSPLLSACVAGPANPSAARSAELANLVSRSVACRAGNPRGNTLERFLASEAAQGATPEQIASARSTYLTVSEAKAVNQGVRPEPCTAEERAELKARMAPVRAGDFGGL